MRIDDIKYALTDWFRGRHYSAGQALLIAMSIVLVACLIWIGSFLVGGNSYPVPKPSDSPAMREARSIVEQLHADGRFRHIAAAPSPDDPNVILVGGEVYTKADKAALQARVLELTSKYAITVDHVYAMDGE